VSLVVLQTGAVPEQSALPVQRTHTPLVVLHTGVPPPHAMALPAEHWPQAPDGSQAGVVPPHSPSPPQARHVRNAGSQMGLLPAQSPFARQPTHVLVEVLHSVVAPLQVVLSMHSTHVAVAVSHAAVPPPQKALFVAEHCPQAPLARHTGAVEGHSLSAAQARQAFVPVSHVGFVPEQLASARQPTHTRGDAVVRQYGVAPPQSESCAHASIVTGVGAGGDPDWLPLPFPFDR
jgi:hypothetical protein